MEVGRAIVIPVGADRVVLKRGLRELLLEGAETVRLVEHMLPLLDGSPDRSEVVEAFPGPWREHVGQIFDALGERGLLDDGRGDAGGLDGLQDAFFANFPLGAAESREQIGAAEVVVVGLNRTTQALVESLVASGVGRLTLVSHPGLDTAGGEEGPAPAAWTRLAEASRAQIATADENALAESIAGGTVTVAGCDLGEADALLDVNRAALAAGRPFLPFWISELVGHVGPLVYPFETACLRCYRLRIDSNDPHRAVNRPVRSAVAAATDGCMSPGLVPPMPRVVGDVAAMEVLKILAPFAPSDVVARAIEINLVSFSSVVRRVLKLPRCPDCSEVMDTGAVTTRVGPQITQVGLWAG